MNYFDLKHNGHPVSPKDISFFDEERLSPKEACDVHSWIERTLRDLNMAQRPGMECDDEKSILLDRFLILFC